MKYIIVILFTCLFSQCTNASNSNNSCEDLLIAALEEFYKGDFKPFFALLSQESLDSIPDYFKEYDGIFEMESDILEIQYVSPKEFVPIFLEDGSIKLKEVGTREGEIALMINQDGFTFQIDTTASGMCLIGMEKRQLISLLKNEPKIRYHIYELLSKNNQSLALLWLMGAGSYDIDNDKLREDDWFLINRESAYSEKELLNLYKKAAIEGNLLAMVTLGQKYNNDDIFANPPSDFTPDASLTWYLMAAQRGHILSMMRVADKYEKKEMYEEAFKWYQKLYNLEPFPFNILDFASHYQLGRGCEKDLEKAKNIYNEAFEEGHKNSRMAVEIGLGYEYGQDGLPKDTSQAIYWYETAIQLGDNYAKKYLKDVVRDK